VKKVRRLDEMTRGWFVGDFDPSALRTPDCEVAVMRYSKGDRETRHYHAVAAELTVVVSGQVMMEGDVHGEGEIVLLEPGDRTDFVALTDAVTVVVKVPSVRNDKFTD
jgi:quercetin dioxygenase-like cupin family protein